MPFTSALTATQLDVLRTGSFGANVYMMIWTQEIIFQAQINQSTFQSSFPTITYDNVTTGAYTDLKSDFICYVDATAGNTRDAQYRFRVRDDGSGTVADATTLYINETSAALEDDLYIMVVKDVGCEAKVPKTLTAATPASYDYPRDYGITFRRLLGTIYGLQSVYVGKLNSSGYIDFNLPAVALVADNDASEDTWLWDLDGLAFQTGDAATAQITARATAAGQYMPRVSHTDDAGNAWYFTLRVFVVPADYSTTVNLAFANYGIDHDITNGLSLSVSAPAASNQSLITRIDQMPDLSFCAVWVDTQQPVPTSDIAFCGWFLQETIQNTFTADGNTLLNTQFQCQGIGGRMSDTISRRVPMTEDSTPTVFGQIEDLTPWRAVVYFLTEHTTVPNICAVQFSDVTETFRYPRFGSTDSSVLASVLDILFTINGAVEYSRSGELYLDRKAWMLPTAGRTALTTVANWTTTDMATADNGGPLFSISRAMIAKVGREMGGGGVYDTTTEKVQVLRATTPAVAQSQGNELATYNRQVLTANSAIGTASDELGQRNADDMEARNPQTIMAAYFPPAYWWMQAHAGQWHTWAIAKSDNNRGISYTSSIRWILRRISIRYRVDVGIWNVNGDFQKETQGTSWQSLAQLPLNGQVNYFYPVMPVAPAYQAYPESPVANYADPTDPTDDDAPPFDADDVGVVSYPQQPGVWVANNQSSNNAEGMVWDNNNLWGVRNIPGTPTYTDYTPPDAGIITNGKFARTGARAWCISNAEGDSSLWRTTAFGDNTWVSTAITGHYIRIGVTSTAGQIYAYSPNDGWFEYLDFRGDDNDFEIEEGLGNFGADGIEGTQNEEEGPIGIDARITVDSTLFNSAVIVYSTTDLSESDSDVEVSIGSTKVIDVHIPAEGAERDINAAGFAVTDTDIKIFFDTGLTEGNITVHSLTLTGTGTNPFGGGGGEGSGDAVTVYSTNHGGTVAGPVAAGVVSAVDSGFDVIRVGPQVYIGIDDEVQSAEDGEAYSSATGGGCAGSYPLCIWAYGTDAIKYLFSTAAAVGGETLWYVEEGSATAITPNDGANDGIVATADSLCTDPASDDHIFGLFAFSGTVKFAYSPDQGTSWQFNTQVSDDACYIRCKYVSGHYHVYICDAAILWYGQWNGLATSSITLHAKGTPSAAIKGVEIR